MRPTGLQHVALAGLVATLLFLPLGALLALLCYLIFDVSLHAFVTFGDRLSEPFGLVAWWVIAWLLARAYVASVSGSGLESRGTRPNQ
jgi:hypothetical protein